MELQSAMGTVELSRSAGSDHWVHSAITEVKWAPCCFLLIAQFSIWTAFPPNSPSLYPGIKQPSCRVFSPCKMFPLRSLWCQRGIKIHLEAQLASTIQTHTHVNCCQLHWNLHGSQLQRIRWSFPARLHPEVEPGECRHCGWASSTCTKSDLCTLSFCSHTWRTAGEGRSTAHQRHAHCCRLLVNTGFSAFN